MNVRVIRERSSETTTFGVVLIESRFFCFSLEDPVREKPGQPVHAWKIPGVTAIPSGRYRLGMRFSPKFDRVLPEVQNVTGFTDIMVHPLNDATESLGCIGFGKQRDDERQRLVVSRVACDAFQALLASALQRQEPCWLQTENPVEW